MKRASISKVALYWHTLVMIAFSMIACQMINHREPGFCSDDRDDERAERALSPTLVCLSSYISLLVSVSVSPFGSLFFPLHLCLDFAALTQSLPLKLSPFMAGYSSKYCTY